MASIIDAIRSVYTDNFSLLKLGLLSFGIYALFSLTSTGTGFNVFTFLLWLLIVYVYLGFCTIIISNRINQRIETLPKFNPVLFFNAATQSSIIAIPLVVVGLFVVNLVIGLFNFEGLPQQIALWMIRFFIFCILVTSLIYYAEKYKLKDGFNVVKISTGLADVLVYTIICALLIALISIFTSAPTLYLVYTFFKFGPLFQYVAVFFITMNLAFIADYWGQLYFDIESKNNYY